MSKHFYWRTIGKATYNISQDTEVKSIFGEAFVDTLLKKRKILELDNVVCISLSSDYTLHSTIHTLYQLERYDARCQWRLDSAFEELWRRRNAYEAFNEIWKKLGIFIEEAGIIIKDLHRYCKDLIAPGLESIHKCKICGENYKPPDFEVITLRGAVKSRETSGFCPTISICRKCYERLLEKGIIKKSSGIGVFPSKEYLRNFALLWFYCKLHGYLKYLDFIAKVGDPDFFKKIAAGVYSSLFDFVCIDDKGERYVIDVKTTTSQMQTTSKKISKELERSSKYIQLALDKGFRVLMPIVRLEKDWRIVLELVEITQ